MAAKANEMVLKLGDGYTQWDLICLVCMQLATINDLLPDLKMEIAKIIGTFVDGEVILRSSTQKENGILPLKS